MQLHAVHDKLVVGVIIFLQIEFGIIRHENASEQSIVRSREADLSITRVDHFIKDFGMLW
jgi:hypothetical protein